ncbi:hypothetical protein [Mycolicibacterium setense]
MPAVSIETDDLEPFATIDPAKAAAMIADALAMAKLVAPCIADVDFAHPDAAKAVIRGAILRWNEAGQGAVSQLQAMSFSQMTDTRQPRRAMFWPSEIEQLQKMCQDPQADSGAWGYDAAGTGGIWHADTCAINFGATYCDCGAIYTGAGPIWEPPQP